MRLLIVACGFVLLVAVGLQVVAALLQDSDQSSWRLIDRFPAQSSHWSMIEEPIAETPEMAKAVGELLNFDDAVFRSYRNGARQFDVYAAFWRPGKMSERLVAGHTPDVCWVAAGWKRIAQDAMHPDLAGSAGVPARGQYRVFKDPQGSFRWVAFWHKAGSELVAYDPEGGLPAWWTVFTDLADRRLGVGRSQYFVRISSNVPWEDLARDPDFRAVAGTVRVLLK